MIGLFSNIYSGRHILRTMVMKDIKTRYTGSVFGPLWLVATPLYQIILYTFLFSTILKVRFADGSGTSSFVVYLLAGLIPWIFFSEATTRGISAFIDNAHIIKKVKFPIEICIITVVVSSMVTFLIYTVIYLAMLMFMGLLKLHMFPLFIVPFAIQVLLILGLSFGMGSIAVFFRDITQATGMILNLIFFVTPIVYPSNAIPSNLLWFFNLNPFYSIVEIYRDILVRGSMPDAVSLIYPAVVGVVVFGAGYYVFHKTKEAFKDIL